MEDIFFHAHENSHLLGNESGTDAGNQSRIVHSSDTGHLYGKESGGHGSAEERGEGGGNTAHDNDPFVLIVKAQDIAQGLSKASSDLQGSAFPPDGAAAEDGDHGGDKNQKSHPRGEGDIAVNAFYHRIRALILLIFQLFVQKNDDKAAKGKQ